MKRLPALSLISNLFLFLFTAIEHNLALNTLWLEHLLQVCILYLILTQSIAGCCLSFVCSIMFRVENLTCMMPVNQVQEDKRQPGSRPGMVSG